MSEEEKEIIKEIDDLLEYMQEEFEAKHSCFNKREYKAVKGLLDLYQQEKEKNKKAIEYINKNCSTNNCDFMDDGVGNLFKDILELLEERR